MKKLLFAIFAAAILISGCDKTETGGPGRLSVKITDDPFDISSVESATITISKIEIRQTGADEGNPFIELLMDPVTINIFELRNGITQELVNLEVPKGDYDLVRLYVDEANLKLKDINEQFNLKVPSGEQTGIKVFISPVIHVEGGISAELLLDFDLSKSFVMRGHNAQNGFIFKPCIRATNNSTAGRIEGFVKDNSPEKIGIENAKVSLQTDAAEPVITFTDASGHYAFIGVPAGTYSMSATRENYVDANIEGVVVVPGNKTARDFVLVGLPVYVSSVIENATPAIIEMTYSLTLADIVPDVSAFEVTVATVARTVSSVAVSGKIVRLTLSSAVVKGDAVTVAYTKPAIKPLQTPDGLQVPTFTSQNVTNKVN
ncbi:MAG: hypothetical protein H6Q23_1515 [Bacteroidetes bacterium]|nr:hypothetical protein [Bacteroidota bacterium]